MNIAKSPPPPPHPVRLSEHLRTIGRLILNNFFSSARDGLSHEGQSLRANWPCENYQLQSNSTPEVEFGNPKNLDYPNRFFLRFANIFDFHDSQVWTAAKRISEHNFKLASIMRYSALLCLLLSPFNALANGSSVTADGKAILIESDSFRSLGENFTFDLTITDSENQNRELTVYIKDHTKGLVKLISPASSAGRSFLFLNNNIWQYSASTGRASRLHPQYQFLAGIDNFDLVGTGFSNHYEVHNVNFSSGGIQLDLQASTQDSPYQTVVLKVARKDYRPLQASFYPNEDYMNDGTPKKTVFYEDYKEFRKEDHPTQIRIIDHENNERETTMHLSVLRKTDTPDAWFNPQFLERFN